MTDFFNELDMAVTVCNSDGIIIYMNQKSIKTFINDGGSDLIGTKLLDCHPEPARTKLMEMTQNKTANTYTIEKNGMQKMIIQKPWYNNGEYAGFVELSVVLPDELPHFVRK